MGLSFDDLSVEDKKKVFEYKFVTRLLPEIQDEQIRDIFQRINRNTTVLNAQELRHATYWGKFIRLMEEIADIEYFATFGIFSANDRRRMLDAEFVSELAVAYLNGLQNKKTKLEDYYQLYEREFDDAERLKSTFLIVLGEISQVLPEISKTRFKKKSDFYTLFLLLAENVANLPLADEKRRELRKRLTSFASTVDAVISGDLQEAGAAIMDYAKNVERAASDLGSRRARHDALGFEILDIIK